MLNDDILKDLDSLDEDKDEQQNVIAEELSNQNYPNDINQFCSQSQNKTFTLKKGRLSLLQDESFTNHMKIINDLIDKKIQTQLNCSDLQQQKNYIQKSNEYALKIDRQIDLLYRSVKVVYYHRFPQLQSIVTKPALYCKAAHAIETHFNRKKKSFQTPIQQINLAFLSSHQIIALKTAISSLHEQITPQSLNDLLQACQEAILLNEHRNALMIYLEASMQLIAPNLCQFVGSSTASKLISAAGGIDKLANTPACNVQLLGGQRPSLIGFSLLETHHTGIFKQLDYVKEAPRKFQMQLVRMLAANTVKCAKADLLGSKNNIGAKFKEQMFERFQKIQQEGGLMRTIKPLQVPGLQPKKKRGGKRHRKMKQLYERSEFRKNQNRLQFGVQAQIQYGTEGQGLGLGLLKASGLSKRETGIKKQKLNLSKKMNKKINKKSGIQSSLDFGSKQGLELVNPEAATEKKSQVVPGTESYFSKESGFRTILSNKFGFRKNE